MVKLKRLHHTISVLHASEEKVFDSTPIYQFMEALVSTSLRMIQVSGDRSK